MRVLANFVNHSQHKHVFPHSIWRIRVTECGDERENEWKRLNRGRKIGRETESEEVTDKLTERDRGSVRGGSRAVLLVLFSFSFV